MNLNKIVESLKSLKENQCNETIQKNYCKTHVSCTDCILDRAIEEIKEKGEQ